MQTVSEMCPMSCRNTGQSNTCWQFCRDPCPWAGLSPAYSTPLAKSFSLPISYTSLHHRQFYWCQLIYHLFSLALMIFNLPYRLYVFTQKEHVLNIQNFYMRKPLQTRAYLTTSHKPMSVLQHWVPKSLLFPIMEHLQVEMRFWSMPDLCACDQQE